MKRSTVLLAFFVLAGCTGGGRMRSTIPDQARAPLDKAEQADLYLGVVSGLIKQGRYEAAMAFLDSYAQEQAITPRYQLLRGDALLGAKRYDDSAAAYSLAAQSEFAAHAYNGLGRVEGARGRWNVAMKDFQRASMLDPVNAGYLNNLGYAKLRQGQSINDSKSAQDDLRRAHELDPGSPTIQNNFLLATNLSHDDAQYSRLLAAIDDAQRRARVAAFVNGWDGSNKMSDVESHGGIQ